MEVVQGSMRRTAGGVIAAVVALALVIPPTPGSATITAPPKGGSRVGVSRRVIKLGMHMPLTGAAALPDEAAEEAADIYFQWLQARGRDINGRHVQVVLRNDNYNPSTALDVCKQMVREDRVFALIGYSGMDQIQTCAKYAARAHVPYIAPGTTERGMDLPQTFVTSMTWPAQGKLMADFMITKLKARRRGNAMVWYNTSNLKGIHSRFVRSMKKRDADVFSRSVPTQANTADATAVIQELKVRDIKNVFVHVTPMFWLQLLRAASQQNYEAQWTGVDPALQHGSVGMSGCGFNQNADGSKFFSPYPALADRDRFDKKFDRAMAEFHPNEEADEIHWGNWAQQKVIARLLRRPGRNLTRKRFVYFAERARKIKTGVLPRLHYRPKDHFGGRQIHLNRLSCNDREWHTKKAFVSDFKRKKKR
jgi:ABC-type branched-subunit amino acid transport system substrate-binding protein